MGFYSRYVFPHIIERLSAGPDNEEQRRLALASARGEVLEIGFGTGKNFAHSFRTAGGSYSALNLGPTS